MSINQVEEAFPNLLGKSLLNWDKYGIAVNQRRVQLENIIKSPFFLTRRIEENCEETKEIYGYKGMSNEEILKKVSEESLQDDSLEKKISDMNKLWSMGMVSSDAMCIFDLNLAMMERKEYIKTFNPQSIDMQSEHYLEWKKNGGMEGIHMSWEEMRESMFSNLDIAADYGPEIADELNNLFDILSGKK